MKTYMKLGRYLVDDCRLVGHDTTSSVYEAIRKEARAGLVKIVPYKPNMFSFEQYVLLCKRFVASFMWHKHFMQIGVIAVGKGRRGLEAFPHLKKICADIYRWRLEMLYNPVKRPENPIFRPCPHDAKKTTAAIFQAVLSLQPKTKGVVIPERIPAHWKKKYGTQIAEHQRKTSSAYESGMRKLPSLSRV